MSVLANIKEPKDLKGLSLEELKRLAQEIRGEIIETVSRCGGHLASSLGAVELTIALHYVFDTPNDKIVWDVGHQAYAHKLLTGRKERFHTLRQHRGLSGFLKRSESIYDCFGAGHAGTSISAALGIREALSQNGEEGKVVVVIGDGAMTAGMAFEALNHTGEIGGNLIVVLNDNEMSISPNVGALSSFLSGKLTSRFFVGLKRELKNLIKSIPGIGGDVVKVMRRAEEAIKGFLTPGMLFESLGFEYVGPIDGHRLEFLLETLKNVREMTGPVLLHVVTVKGKGYAPAERDPVSFHSVGPFDPATGELGESGSAPSYTRVFTETLIELAKEDERVVAITAAMPGGTGLDRFAQRFPERFYDVGIAEQHAVTFAAGLACGGLRPVVAIYSTFLQRAYDQVIHDVCLQNLPVVFALDRAGIVGQDGPTHHGLFDLSYLRALPNMTVMAPKDEEELRHMLKTALMLNSPSAIRYPRGRGLGVARSKEIKPLPVGRGEIIIEGKDVALLAIGTTVHPALQAAKNLYKEGVEASVVNCRFVKPLDAELICSLAARIGKLITVEENVLAGGFGSAVLELLQDKRLNGVEVCRLGIPDVFVEQGPQELLRQEFGIDQMGIEAAARRLMKRDAKGKKRATG